MKNYFAILLLFLSATARAEPKDLLGSIQRSIGDATDLGTLWHNSLELANYYEKQGMRADAEAIYLKIAATIKDEKNITQLAVNAAYITILADRLESSKDERTSSIGSNLRVELIRRSLNEAGSDEKQNNNMESLGMSSAGTLAEQLGKAKEFKGLFQAAIKSFPLDNSELQSASRARDLMYLINSNRFGMLGGQGSDEIAMRMTDIEDKKHELETLQSQALKKPEDSQMMQNLTEAIEKETALVATLKQKQTSKHTSRDARDTKDKSLGSPCWVDPRIPLDDAALAGFTCAGISIGLLTVPDSAQGLNLLKGLTANPPYSSFAASCTTQDLKLKDREREVARANRTRNFSPGYLRCKLPEDLKETQNKSSGRIGVAVAVGEEKQATDDEPKAPLGDNFELPDSGGCADCGASSPDFIGSPLNPSNSFTDCEHYEKDIREFKAILQTEADHQECKSSETEYPRCLDRIETEASTLGDRGAIAILADIAREKYSVAGSDHPETTLARAVSRLQTFSSSVNPSSVTESSIAQKNMMLALVDTAFSSMLSSAGSSKNPGEQVATYEEAENFVGKITDSGLRNFLSIHILERFAEQANPNARFADPALDATMDYQKSY